MFQLVYVSSATVPLDDASLRALLATSRQKNAVVGVSGLLLYRDGNFMQVIEGERQTVEALHQRIGQDARHRGLITMFAKEVAQRDFPDWSMGFRNLKDPELLKAPGFSEFLNFDFSTSSSPDLTKAGRLLEVFRAGLR